MNCPAYVERAGYVLGAGYFLLLLGWLTMGGGARSSTYRAVYVRRAGHVLLRWGGSMLGGRAYQVSVVSRSNVVVGHGGACLVRYLIVVVRIRWAAVGDLYLVEYR